jgi:hypothetical protein
MGRARAGVTVGEVAGAAAMTLAVALAVAFPGPAQAAAWVERFEGTARTPEGKISYLEEHEVARDGDRLVTAETRYFGPDGRLIAVLRSDYRRDPFAPDYRFEDLRTGTVEAVRRTEDGLELTSDGKQRLLAPAPLHQRVAGQGLDRFTRARLAELASGGELKVELVLPSRLDSYRFRVRSEDGRVDGPLRVRIEPESLLLRLLAPSIVAEYDRVTGRLLRYRGVSNLADDAGGRQQVEITYRETAP